MSTPILRSVEPAVAQAWLERGEAVLVDVREPDEHVRERIPGARLAPLSRIAADGPSVEPGKTLVFHCNSGNRTAAAALQLAASGEQVYQLAGGLEAWRRAGLPVAVDHKAPLPLMRQVQIGAGSLVLLGTLLGLLITPWLLAIPAFVGTGLVVAGVTGFCGLARLLARMPWNRERTAVMAGARAGAAS